MSALLSGLPFMMEILGMFLNNPHSRSKKVMFPTMMMWRRSAYGMFEALMINNDNGCGHNWLLSTQLVIWVGAKNTNLQKNRNVCQESYLSLINSKQVFIIFFVFWKWCIKPEWHDKVPEPKERTVVIGKDTDHDVSGKHGHRGFLPAGTGVCVLCKWSEHDRSWGVGQLQMKH